MSGYVFVASTDVGVNSLTLLVKRLVQSHTKTLVSSKLAVPQNLSDKFGNGKPVSWGSLKPGIVHQGCTLSFVILANPVPPYNLPARLVFIFTLLADPFR